MTWKKENKNKNLKDRQEKLKKGRIYAHSWEHKLFIKCPFVLTHTHTH